MYGIWSPKSLNEPELTHRCDDRPGLSIFSPHGAGPVSVSPWRSGRAVRPCAESLPSDLCAPRGSARRRPEPAQREGG